MCVCVWGGMGRSRPGLVNLSLNVAIEPGKLCVNT